MKITNRFNLPQVFENFVRADKYTRGTSDISVTQLIDSPSIRVKRQKYADKMEMDVVDRVWSLFGTAVHHVLETTESSGSVKMEERLYADIKSWSISGALDHQEVLPDGTIQITDYKVTSAWSVLLGKVEWERQQNCYAWLVENSKGGVNRDRRVSSIRICAILRDWQRKKAEFDKDYPQSPVVTVELPLWSSKDRTAYIKDRISLHQEAQMMYDLEGDLGSCSSDERWSKPDTWAVKKKGQKRALKVHGSEEEAIAHAESNSSLKGNCEVEYREGEATRCVGNYCSVADFCPQYLGSHHE